MEAIVEHDYVAQESDELTIKKGDHITQIVRKQTGWCEGVLNERRGLFPNNFVRMLGDKRRRKCRVVFSYKQDHEDELNLNVGEVIDVLGEEEEGWWRGVLNGREGVFPSNFVQEVGEDGVEGGKTPLLPPKPAKIHCEVKYNYKAQNDDELTLKEGDIVTLISKDGQDAGWWRGELHGRMGVFPDNFVVIIEEHPVVEPTQQQRTTTKSLDIDATKVKKPAVPLKKSPSASPSGGLLSGLKKKIVDAVDGGGGSKVYKVAEKDRNVFDQVERGALLSDVRATRAKAPGRRPRSVIAKDDAAPHLNGTINSDYGSLEEPNLSSSNTSIELENSTEKQAKTAEWKKQKAPWLEEMKLNQAKRTSLSPGPEVTSTTTTTTTNPSTTPNDATETNTTAVSPNSQVRLLRNPKPTISQRPSSLENATAALKPPILAKVVNKTPTPTPVDADITVNHAHGENMSAKQYNDLVERVKTLEARLERQQEHFQAALDELKGKIQVETDLRMMLQAELEKLSHCVMQV